MPAGPLALAFLLLCFHLASRVLAAASLGFYEDGACQTGLAWTTATNPNGTCTDVTGSFGSVKVMLVDSGCAGETLSPCGSIRLIMHSYGLCHQQLILRRWLQVRLTMGCLCARLKSRCQPIH